jgi:hypothetical protein
MCWRALTFSSVYALRTRDVALGGVRYSGSTRPDLAGTEHPPMRALDVSLPRSRTMHPGCPRWYASHVSQSASLPLTRVVLNGVNLVISPGAAIHSLRIRGWPYRFQPVASPILPHFRPLSSRAIYATRHHVSHSAQWATRNSHSHIAQPSPSPRH